MGGVPLDIMDKVKSLFKRLKDKSSDKPATNGTTGTKTETPTAPAVPEPTKTETAAAPSTAEPTAAPAAAAPVEEPKTETPAEPTPAAAAAPTPA